ncbi:MAG: hypothetical protein NZ585_08910 [Chloracidobacterium sp.]|nr:hypothetical protein [Chloracidobacterium sp.]MDW8217424.1 hypothetical protein [Acidobacteriota bacterium]
MPIIPRGKGAVGFGDGDARGVRLKAAGRDQRQRQGTKSNLRR